MNILRQNWKNCSVKIRIDRYDGLSKLSRKINVFFDWISNLVVGCKERAVVANVKYLMELRFIMSYMFDVYMAWRLRKKDHKWYSWWNFGYWSRKNVGALSLFGTKITLNVILLIMCENCCYFDTIPTLLVGNVLEFNLAKLQPA